ncbi:voltage-gated potassium channel [Sediminibacillus albus]|uniref:Voltage-gated potassium channel n=2 Tax=Sediminibacillus albus TaxID=407036 RepID=A0A1G8ZX81_9BACI|nr:voltage-gated potassium channel [Sediminibacillus albus]
MVYEIFMIMLASFSVATIWKNNDYGGYIVWVTWAIFFADFVYRLKKSENKWKFIKSNPFLVIAVIPLDAIFQFARFARILHLLRLKTITKYYTMPFIKFFKRQHLGVIFTSTFVIVFISIIPIYSFEPEVTSYWEAMIGSLMSLTFFGQGGFDPATPVGHVTVVILTIFGVILHGLVISTAFDYIYHSSLFKRIVKKINRKQAG